MVRIVLNAIILVVSVKIQIVIRAVLNAKTIYILRMRYVSSVLLLISLFKVNIACLAISLANNALVNHIRSVKYVK